MSLSILGGGGGGAPTANFVNGLVGNTAGNSSSGSGSVFFAGGSNVTLSGATAAGGETISIVAAPGTISFWRPGVGGENNVNAFGQGSFAVFGTFAPMYVTATRVDAYVKVSLSTSSNSSASGKITVAAGLYSLTGGTLSLGSSGSQTYSWSNTSDGSSTLYTTFKALSIPINVNVTPGEWWIGFASSTGNTAAGNMLTFSNVYWDWGPSYRGVFGVADNASNGMLPGLGWFSAAVNGTPPNSMALTDIAGNAGRASIPVLHFMATSF